MSAKWMTSPNIENEIYGVMEDYEIGFDVYEEGLVDAISDFFAEFKKETEYKIVCSEWPDCSGGVCFVCWIENGHLGSVSFDYKKAESVC
jgi:hypothetical protein